MPGSSEVYHAASPPPGFETNKACFDDWTKVHILSGVFTGLIGIRPSYAASGAVAYEILEYAHEWPSGSVIFGSKRPESIGNVVADLVVFGLGYLAASAVRERMLRARGLRDPR